MDGSAAMYLESEVARLDSQLKQSELHARVIAKLSRYRLPDLRAASTAQIVKLRQHDEAFAEFRSSLTQILALMDALDIDDPDRFVAEFKEASEQLLVPRIHQIDAARKNSGALQQLIGGALTLGGAVAEYRITHQPPIGTTISAGAAEASWLTYRVTQKFSRERKGQDLLREFYGYLIPSE